MPMEMKVKDIMSTRVVTCPANATVAFAAKKMRDEDVGSIIIIENKKPVGIMTREDITNRVAAEDKLPSKVLVKDVMTMPVITASPDDTLSAVAKRMSTHGYERMPVKRLNKLIGFISVRDVLRVSPGALDLLKEHLEKEQAPEIKEEFNSGDCELCGNFSEQLHNINDRWVCDTCKEEAAEL